jgi:hypothetical protein
LEFKPGELAIFVIEPGLHVTQDGFVTVCTRGKSLFVPEKIDLESYPSCSDFKGKLTEVKSGDLAVVLKYVGRPYQITRDPDWFQYDVYRLYINGTVCHAFKHNLRRIDYRVDCLV